MRRLTIVALAVATAGLEMAGLGAAGLGAAGLGASLSPAVAASPLPVQYDGPMMGGPGYGMPPGYGPDMDPDMGPGPFMGPGPYGPGDGGRMPRRHRSRAAGPFTTYHGFRIDTGEAQGRINVPRALEEVEHQIDIVDRSGVSPSMLAGFRAVPIRISASFVGGSHYDGGPEVSLGSLQPGDDRPVLLHEYMHVLEYRTFPGRFHNPQVVRFYEEARARGLFPAGAYMMSNPAEYFAVTASCYLNGSVARDPYTRAAIREHQPDYYAYLSRLFGPRLETAGRGAAEPRRVAER